MSKGKIGCVVVVLAVLGLLVWGFFQFGVYAPRVWLIHIETPGGPVPIKIIFFDPDSAIIDVGNGDRAAGEPLFSGRDQDFLIHKFEWSSPSFKIEFPRNQTVLVLEPIAHERGEYRAEGKLIVREGQKNIGELIAMVPRVMRQNWFDPSTTPEVDEPSEDFYGRWMLQSQTKQEVSMIDIFFYRRFGGELLNTNSTAVLLSFSTEHRNFAGRITGNRIRLASFDNAYPALIDATIQDDGTLKGDLWVGDRLHESFTANRQ